MPQKTKNDYSQLLRSSEADIVVGLNRHGQEVSTLFKLKTKKNRDQNKRIFPVMVDNYSWSRVEQIKNAKIFRDRIEYLYYPEADNEHPMLATWRLDDTARLKAILNLPFGRRVLETGCSSGTVSIEIAKLPKVKKVMGIDLRPEAIVIANQLTAKLKKTGNLSVAAARKLTFKHSAAEDLNYSISSFDSVCAFEVLEHLTPADFHKVLINLQKLLSRNGKFFVSVPNRYPSKFYVKAGRTRWGAPDHKNYFSKENLTYLLSQYFKSVTFYSVDNRPIGDGVYLLAEAEGKKV